MDWINLVQDVDKWPSSVNMVMYLRVLRNTVNFLKF